MNNAWYTHHGLAEAPTEMMDRERHELFQIVPPTQRGRADLLPSHTADYDPPKDRQEHHLRPSASPYSLRTHRSMSSVASLDSQISGLSSMTGWSTLTGSDPTSEGDLVGEGDSHPFAHLRHHGYQEQTRADPHGNLNPLGRQPSLSIDPKLFQHKERVEVGLVEEEMDEQPTAVPAVVKGPGGKKTKGDRKSSHARKSQQHPEHIPRPRNAFILFRKHVVDSKLIPASVEMRHQNVSIIVAKMWSEASPEQKAHFNDLARIEKEEHLKKYPGYRYQPVYRRTNVIRRRVRKDEAEEEKCHSVAQLLLAGKTGQKLETEIKEKIRREPAVPRKRDRPIPRRSSAACELSKGALRALRAEARQHTQGSGDWSDFSPEAGVEMEASSLMHSRQSSLATDHAEPSDMSYLSHPGSDMAPYFGLASEAMAYLNPGQSTWGAAGQAMPNHLEQGFAFPQPMDPSRPFAPTPPRIPQHAYPQPHRSIPDIPTNDFYSYDQALPFSPGTQSRFAPSNAQYTEQRGLLHDLPSDIIFAGQYPLDGPSPTSAAYMRGPMSARWDRGHMLPPSSEVPLEGLPFDEGEMVILPDFGQVLGHGDGEMAGGW